jgi:S-methylmethionine-dependent homocysteine/selenocysteine methylase
MPLCCDVVCAGAYDPDGTITPEAYLRHARAWAAAGADIIGGCCGVGPQHMQLLADVLKGQ